MWRLWKLRELTPPFSLWLTTIIFYPSYLEWIVPNSYSAPLALPRNPPRPPNNPPPPLNNHHKHKHTHILPFENYVTNHRIHILKNESWIDGIQLKMWFEAIIWEWTCASWGNGKAAGPPACVSNFDTSESRLKFQIKPSALERKR